MTRARTWWRAAGWAALCLAVWCAGVGMRRHVLDAQRALTKSGELHFTLESALAYRRVQLVYRDGGLPERDLGVGWPLGIDNRKTDTVDGAWPMAAACRAWPGLMAMEERVHWLHLLWWSLALPGVVMLVRAAGGGWFGAAFGGLVYAVAVSAVARTTGQELSHENDAWPFFVWHLVCWTMAGRGGKRREGWLGWVGAALAAVSLCFWDLMQFYLGALGVWGAVRAVRGTVDRRESLVYWLPLTVAVVLAGALHPYFRAHLLLLSPVPWLLSGVMAAGGMPKERWERRLASAVVQPGVVLVLGWCLLAAPGLGGTVDSYGHFGELLWAKLRWLNQRPTDPKLLTFDQRILWTSGLMSTSWRMVVRWFPAMLWPLAGWGVWRWRKRRAGADAAAVRGPATPGFAGWCAAVSLGAFALFFRFHIWVALAAAALGGVAFGRWWRGGGRKRRIWLAVAAVAVLGAETAQTLDRPTRWGGPSVYPDETAELMEHLRTYTAPDPVLANFGVSGSIAAYGGCPVVLHPKFESGGIRKKVREYGEALFKGTEEDFARWMDLQRAVVYVHSMGELSNLKPEASMRFMVDALEPAQDAAVRLFEERPEELQRFKPEFANRKYRVYRLQGSGSGRLLAAQRAELATEALGSGKPQCAEAYATAALRADPDNESAQGLLQLLNDDAFQLGDADPDDEDQAFALYEHDPVAPPCPW